MEAYRLPPIVQLLPSFLVTYSSKILLDTYTKYGKI